MCCKICFRTKICYKTLCETSHRPFEISLCTEHKCQISKNKPDLPFTCARVLFLLPLDFTYINIRIYYRMVECESGALPNSVQTAICIIMIFAFWTDSRLSG